MESASPPIWLFYVAFGWIGFVIAASILWRKMAGKAIFPQAPANPIFVERRASSATRMASRCLLIVVTEDVLIVTPTFPFNLMFLPQVYGLEHEIPRASITQVGIKSGWLGNNVVVFYGGGRKLGLRLDRPAEFGEAIRPM